MDGVARVEKPCGGDGSAACWSAQGLLATDTVKQQVKVKRATILAAHRGILVMTETHGNEGKRRGRRIPEGFRAFWSNGGEGKAGISAWVMEEFMKKVEGSCGGRAWVEVCSSTMFGSGRQAPSLQVGVVYLQTGSSGGRKETVTTMRKVVAELEGWGNALTIVTGDFNYVVDKMDRVSGGPPEYSGGAEAREAEDMNALLGRVGLQELEQNEFTYRFEGCRSRLDRIYTNMGRYEWMDRDIGCSALDWDDKASRHRPIAGFSRIKAETEFGERPINSEGVGAMSGGGGSSSHIRRRRGKPRARPQGSNSSCSRKRRSSRSHGRWRRGGVRPPLRRRLPASLLGRCGAAVHPRGRAGLLETRSGCQGGFP